MQKLPNAWYIACSAAELGARPIRRVVEGETLALFRDASGRPQAVADRCAHRGMALSAGKVVDGCVQCPYHGWRYDGEGMLKAVPALCEGEPLPLKKALRAFPVREQQGQVWVWTGDEAPKAEPYAFARHGDPGWSSFVMQTRMEAPVELCLENFLDVPHTIFAHPGLFRAGEQHPTKARVTRGADSVVAEFLNEPDLSGWGPRLVLPKGAKMVHTDRFIMPSITRVDYAFGPDAGVIISSQCTQREEYVVDVTTFITWKLRLPGFVAKPFLKWYCRRVIQQDVDVLKIQGEQIRKFGKGQVSTKADLLGGHIRELRRRALDGLGAGEEVVEEAELRI